MISREEKTSIQARCRRHPSLAPGKARRMRVHHEYDRGGPLAHLAAYHVHQANVFGQRAPSTGIELPHAVMVHTPVHASRLNQAEIYLSVIQRKVVSPHDYTNLNQVQQRLADFEQRYNTTARPFQCKFTPTDLEDPLARIDQHQQRTASITIPQAA